MNKPVYLVIPMAELSKILMSEFRYARVKSKYGEKARFSCMGIDIQVLLYT